MVSYSKRVISREKRARTLKGKKEYTGELAAFDESSFTIMVNGAEMKILRKDASSVRPYIDFNSLATVDINDYDNIEIEEENE